MKCAFFDVDTLVDFMTKNGKLYIKDSEKIIPNISKLTKYGYENNIKILGCGDRHFGDTAHKEAEIELDVNGGPFPMHCEDDTNGCSKIEESTTPEYSIHIDSEDMYSEELLKILLDAACQITFEKQSYNVFWDETNPGGNQNIDFCLKYLDIDTFFVYGVATEYCVLAAVLGLLKRGKKVWVIDDCIYHITEEGKQNALFEMMKAGALFIRTDSVINLINRDFNG